MLRPALAALALLTRVPLGRAFSAAELARAARFFPLVGALVGLAQILLMHLLAAFLPPLLLSVCLLAAAAWLTGGLHLDGLADTADGFGGGQSREEILRIMRDPVIGSFGAIALALVLMLKAGAIGALIERHAAAPFLVLAPALGRWTMVALGRALPYARPEGGLGSVAGAVTRWQLALATAMTAAVSVPAGVTRAAVCWLAAGAVTLVLGRFCARRLGGFTGDVLGASNELAEVTVLVAGVVLTR